MLKIPKRIEELLNQEPTHYAYALKSIESVRPWIEDNKTPFFPEYTDHGTKHLHEVLLTANSIISDRSWQHLTPQDASSMVIATLLHDCAMHLSEDGFYCLIGGTYPSPQSRYIEDEKSWPELWSEFVSEAKRFDAKKLYSLFGDQTPLRVPPSNKNDLTHRDKLLIGEFIRRHHARLAHEIALSGIPGPTSLRLKIAEEPTTNFSDLCGFIARSHNMGLRTSVDKIEDKKRRLHLNTHVPFVMLVLRISDYIQIHAERAPTQLLQVKTLVSPISKQEWKKHHSIIEVTHAHEDPEAIYVDAEPEDAIAFESLKMLLEDIQKELDLSWSVLGEIYGRYEHLNNLGIEVRRVKSSIDNRETFVKEKNPNYIPKVLKFKTADSEMMELLIAPLYGDDPSIGIRELLQNSIDACIELEDSLIKQAPTSFKKTEEDIVIFLDQLDGEEGSVTVQDYGIGMTLSTVENYFLNIGASFRNSDRWKREHETDGKSDVYRTGRFGVGLLAAYLIGNEIQVETRNIREEDGIAFLCSREKSNITVKRKAMPVGTKIKITAHPTVIDTLLSDKEEWDWYTRSSPKVVRRIRHKDSSTETLAQNVVVPGPADSLSGTSWKRTVAEGYNDILWTHDELDIDIPSTYGLRGKPLICNGIFITEGLWRINLKISDKLNIIGAETPALVVYDQDGRLPLNLERSGLVSNQLPFHTELSLDLAKQVAKELIHYCKALKVEFKKSFFERLNNINAPSLKRNYSGSSDSICKLLVNNKKLVPMDVHLLEKAHINEIYVDPANLSAESGAWTSAEIKKQHNGYLITHGPTNSRTGKANWVRAFLEPSDRGYERFSALPITGRRILIRTSDIKDIVRVGYVPKTFWGSLTEEWSSKNWKLMTLGSPPPIKEDLVRITNDLEASGSFGLVVWYLDWANHEANEEASIFSKSFLESNNDSPYIE